jgi:crotonobetainyl-CoA:carnitine CoA-transferase CaiB-like acyl-CoA transferase
MPQERAGGTEEAVPLSALRAVEIGLLPAAAYCARLFADFGAEVIKIEPPAGDPGRRAAPLIQGRADASPESASFAFLNFGKHSATQDVAALLETADVCIASAGTPGVDLAAARAANPGLVVVDMSWFGNTGPYAGFRGSDMACRALAGMVQPLGPAEGPPLVVPDFQAATIGGITGFIAAMAALAARQAGDTGRTLEVSVFEACIAYAELQTSDAWVRGETQPRIGINRFWPTYPVGIYPVKDGWIGITLVTPLQWQGFCYMLGLDDLAMDPTCVLGAERLPQAAALEARFMPKLAEHSVAHWFKEAIARKLPIVPVPSMADILGAAPFRDRGAIATIGLRDRTVEGPASPLHLTRTPPRRGGTVPALGSARPAPRPAPAPGQATGRKMLTGMRVIDLSMGWAGPLATRFLGDLGAEIVKVEACAYADWWRGVDNRPGAAAERLYEKTGRFNALNRSKLGITLDLTHPDGVAALKALVAGADAVVENYAADVLPKLGLDYARLREVNPTLVMASMCAFGSTGPWRDCRAYGSTLEHASGLPSIAGRPGDPPVMGHIAFGDATGGLNAAAALLVALLHRRRTGEGQLIDLSQVECMLPMAAPAMIACSAGATPPRTGNRHPDHAPHGVFPCLGEDQWLAVTVTDDAMWQACALTIGRRDLAADPSLHNAAGRLADQDRIEQALSAWTATQTADRAMAALQEAGVAAGVARAPYALFDDPQLLARGYWHTYPRPFIGDFPQSVLPFREGDAPYPIECIAPTLGQHTDAVLTRLLGYTPERLAHLAREGVTGTETVPSRRTLK